jgi:hypothetical protein
MTGEDADGGLWENVEQRTEIVGIRCPRRHRRRVGRQPGRAVPAGIARDDVDVRREPIEQRAIQRRTHAGGVGEVNERRALAGSERLDRRDRPGRYSPKASLHPRGDA